MKEKIVAFAFTIPLLVCAETLTYEKTVGTKTITTTWEIEEKGSDLVAIERNKQDSTTIIYTKEYATVTFSTESFASKSSYELKRTGSVLNGTKQTPEWTIRKQYSLGKAPWIQNFTFGLRPFLTSKSRSLEFSILNPKNFKMHTLVAKKLGKTELTIAGKRYDALKIELTLPGFKSMFWSAFVWIDPDTQDMLQYKGDEGPGTPTTTIRLISKKG